MGSKVSEIGLPVGDSSIVGEAGGDPVVAVCKDPPKDDIVSRGLRSMVPNDLLPKTKSLFGTTSPDLVPKKELSVALELNPELEVEISVVFTENPGASLEDSAGDTCPPKPNVDLVLEPLVPDGAGVEVPDG